MIENNWPSLLLRWFDAHKRTLPWRTEQPRNPYHVWVSEIMLQQTRTEAVKPYFAKWMFLFPTVEALAEAEEDTVLHAWQGLGYYSRARNLHKAAKLIVSEYGGQMPNDPKALAKLPGIGPYTVGAIASMAFGRPIPAIDGNLLRVLARVYALDDDIMATTTRKKFTALAESIIPQDRPGDWNEAMMDLGAEVCIPKAPRCEQCPLNEMCQAYEQDRTEELPYRAPKKQPKPFYVACAIIERDGKYLLHRRSETGMLALMWEFPMVLSESEPESVELLQDLCKSRVGRIVWQHKHVFSHQVWHMTAYEIDCADVALDESYAWVTPEEWQQMPLAGPHVKLAGNLSVSCASLADSSPTRGAWRMSISKSSKKPLL